MPIFSRPSPSWKHDEHRRAERIARPKVFLFKQRRKPVRVFFISTDDRRANGSATSLVCFVRGCAALPLSEIFHSTVCESSTHYQRRLFLADLRHMGSMRFQSTAMQNRFISDAQSTWVACVAKAPPCSTDSLSMREEFPQHLHDRAGELGHSPFRGNFVKVAAIFNLNSLSLQAPTSSINGFLQS